MRELRSQTTAQVRSVPRMPVNSQIRGMDRSEGSKLVYLGVPPTPVLGFEGSYTFGSI